MVRREGKKTASDLSTLIIILLSNKPQITFSEEAQVKGTPFSFHVLSLQIH